MANTIGYGQGAVNNTIGYGQGAKSGSSFSNTQSIELDGVDDYVDCGTITQINGGVNAFSVSLWFKYSGTLSGTDNILISGANGTANDFYIQPINATTIRYGHGASFTDTTTSNMPINTWQHILAIHNLNTITIYLNGTLQGSANGKPNPNTNIGDNFRIGDYQPLTTYRFQGNIDEVAIWNSDQSSIASAIGSSPVDLSTYSPLSWWRFEGTGTTATDSGSGGNNGTLTNGVTRSSDVPT
jgi:hypothetical protein